jgi:hypothetical protein
MARALRVLDDQRWTQPQDLMAAASAKPDAKANTIVPSPSRYPAALRKQELPVEAFEDIRETQGTLDKFKVILTYADRVDTPFGRAIDRELSTAWRGKPAAAQQYRSGVRSYLQNLTEEVQLIKKSDVTLSGRSATIPVTVQNQLVQGIDDLELRLTSHNPNRLHLQDGRGMAEQPIKVEGGHSQSVKFPASANANGQVQMTAQLFTADGTPYGRPMSFTVRISEITPTVMLVIAGGVLLLVLAGVRMYTQRKRAAADGTAEAVGDDSTSHTDGHTGGMEREQPSDVTPDTGPESGTPSGAGEKVDR